VGGARRLKELCRRLERSGLLEELGPQAPRSPADPPAPGSPAS
jgi:hypothetical protein